MVKLSSLTTEEKAHWELHLKVAQKDFPDNKEIADFLESKTALPALDHPSYIHDWLEKKLEAFNG